MRLPPPSRRTRAIDRGLRWTCAAAALVPVVAVALVFADLVLGVAAGVDPSVVSSVADATLDSLALVALTALLVAPLGLGAAIYLEEYGRRSRLGQVLAATSTQLEAVPSVVHGLVGLTLFVGVLGAGAGLVASAATLALVSFPIVVSGARRGLRRVPWGQREAGLALGATRWRVIVRVVLPSALPAIVSGVLLALTRALGQAAPLLVLGATATATATSTSSFEVLPVQMFAWLARGATGPAAAAGLVLLTLILGLGLLAARVAARSTDIGVRDQERRR